MFDLQTFFLFLAAALLVAVTPGPGIFYIVARTLASGGSEGLASSVGLGIGGLVHVFGGAVGLSALVMASAEAFTLLKIVGGLYLIWLGIKTWREARIVEFDRGSDDGRLFGFSRGHRRRGAQPQDSRILPRVHSTVRRPIREYRRAVYRAGPHLGCSQLARRSDCDLLGCESEGRVRETAIVHR